MLKWIIEKFKRQIKPPLFLFLYICNKTTHTTFTFLVVGPVDKGNERKKDSDAKEDQGEGRQYNPGTAKAVISQWLFLVVFFFGFAGCIGICAAM